MGSILDRVHQEVAAFEAGEKTLASLEGFIGALLRSEVMTPEDASVVLRGAVARGALPADLLRRLRLAPSLEPPASTQIRTPTASSISGRAAAETTFRPAQPALSGGPETGGAESGGKAATGSSWTEPDLHRSATDIAVGTRLGGRYLLERVLGEGGMGVVYLASDQEVPGEYFAIKVLKAAIRDYPEALDLLREEVRRTRALGHPNIVGVYSLNSDRTNIYMIMEYLEGKTLSALIDEAFGRGMPFMRAWPLIDDMCAALAYAHDQNIIHSDIKTSNVFVTTGGKAKLLDFGIARAARGRRNRANTAGLGALTPAYASCEMIEGLEPDARDDIYSLACVIYEMLSGRHPFSEHTAVEARTEKYVPAPLESLSRTQNAALARALSFDRSQRTSSVESLLAGLSLSPQGGDAAASGGSTKPPKPFKLLIGGALAAGAVAIGLFFAWPRLFPTPTAKEKAVAVQAQTTVSQLMVRIEASRRKIDDRARDARSVVERLTDRVSNARNNAEQESLRKQLKEAQASQETAQSVSEISEKGIYTVERLAALREKQRLGEVALQDGRFDEAAQTLTEARTAGEQLIAAADALPAALADQLAMAGLLERARATIVEGQGDPDAALTNARAAANQAAQALSGGDALTARKLFAAATNDVKHDVQAFLDRVIASLGAIAQKKMADNELDLAQEAISQAEALQQLKAAFH